MAGLSGDLEVMSLADLIIWLGNRGKTGTLELESNYIKKEIGIEQGAVVRTTSNDPREYLGQFLLNFGLVTEQQLERAFEVQRETKVLLGRILLMIGLVAEEQISKVLERKVKECILDALRLTTGRFTFQEGVIWEDRPQIEVTIPLVEIHREGAARAPMWEAFKKVFPKPTCALAVVESRVPSQVPMGSADERILSLARAGYTIEDIVMELRAMDFQVYARLFELHRQGTIEAYEPAQRSNGPAQDSTVIRRQDGKEEVLIESVPPPPASAVARADPSAVPTLSRPLDEVLKKRTSAKERYVLARVDGKRTVAGIMQIVPLRDGDVLQILSGLASSGLIRY